MIIWLSNRPRGAVHRCANAEIVTDFLLLYGLPVMPIRRSSLRLSAPDGVVHVVPLARHVPASVAAAYLRSWSLVGVVLCTAMAPFSGHSLALAGLAALCLGLAVFAFGRVGVLDEADVARRLVYAENTGYAMDAWFAISGPWLSALETAVVERARELAPRTYREGARGWRDVALHDDVRDRDFLSAAMTLSSVESGRAHGDDDRRTAKEIHDGIFARLLTLDPSLLRRSADQVPPLSGLVSSSGAHAAVGMRERLTAGTE